MHFKWKVEKFVLKLLVGQNLIFTIAYESKINKSFQFMFFNETTQIFTVM